MITLIMESEIVKFTEAQISMVVARDHGKEKMG
jgi:hypothetical protein